MFKNAINIAKVTRDYRRPFSLPLSACLTVLAASCIAVVGVWSHYLFGQSSDATSGHAIGSDDAYISYRYAWNLFNGNGLIFNLGERVEGYSNFLYTVLMAPAFLIAEDFVYPFSVSLNFCLLVGTIFIFVIYASSRIGVVPTVAGALLLGINPWIWANATTGLETMLTMFVVTLGWVGSERHANRYGVGPPYLLVGVSVASILSRVDGFLLPLAISAYLLLRSRKSSALLIFTVVVGTMGIYTIARFTYYGDVIGNTYYAKVSGGLLYRLHSGTTYIFDNLTATGMWLPIMIGIAGYLRKISEPVSTRLNNPRYILKSLSFAGFFGSLWLIYLIYIGGDIYYERFLIPLFPMMIFESLRTLTVLGVRSLIFWATLICITQLIHTQHDGRFDYSTGKYDCWNNLGIFLHKHHPQLTLAVDAAGKVPFFSHLPTIDMLGLNDRHIGKSKPFAGSFWPGHNKFDPDYVLSRQPELIAAWVLPNFDLSYGLTRDKFGSSYELKYLVNATRIDLGIRNIVDVSGIRFEQQQSLHRHGYWYGVLMRKNLSTEGNRGGGGAKQRKI